MGVTITQHRTEKQQESKKEKAKFDGIGGHAKDRNFAERQSNTETICLDT